MDLTFSHSTSIRQMVAAERGDLVALLKTLSFDEWEMPSLCEGWRVRDVVAHLCYDSVPPAKYLAAFARNGFSGRRLNNELIDRARDLTPTELIGTLTSTIGRGTSTVLAPTVALSDTFVHQQDIRRPLGRPRTIPTDRLLTILNHPDPFASSRHRTRDLRFVATDAPWSRGHGPEVRGPGEAICLAVMGRPAALDQLEGKGLQAFREQFTAN
ncbi:maleylpyruvate isomerase family mycothiol-dependent enzyme [Streptomyces sp. NBC_01497]|uniref:maleylpyruvate isomerase family mycothiol-dependent enzyme n=1 Tax=Streptomyces sp. NBC_01497 TaxID=2903885 RepID=UPI002E331AD2|nr:maleylpyruvate isomerase family mycothiol-dependent enzyme [Streptomyces sp. NBC_01497]